nr:UPF0587 protein C1orf123 homolog [Ipomoea batatas]
MVQYLLMITAELENLTNLLPQGGSDDVNFPFMFKLKCGCGEVTEKETCLSLNETDTHPKKWVVYSRRKGIQHRNGKKEIGTANQANQTENGKA